MVSDSRGRQQRPTVKGQSTRLNGVLVDFASLKPLYGSSFVERLLDGFSLAYLKRSPQVTYYYCTCLRQYLLFVAAEATASKTLAAGKVFDNLVAGDRPAESDFEELFFLFVEKLRDVGDLSLCSTSNITTRNSKMQATGSVLRDLALQGFWPRLAAGESIAPGGLDRGVPSLGELKRSISGHVSGPLSPSYSSVMEANEVRLGALRARLCQTFEEEWRLFRAGAALIAGEPDLDVDEAAKVAARIPKFYGRPGYQVTADPEVERLFPLADKNLMLARLLKILRHAKYATTPMSHLPYGFQMLIALFGGIEKVGRYLQASGIALVSAYTIVLLDTGFNIQPCDDLPEDPFLLKVKKGRQTLSTISAIKLRAAGKITLATLVEEDVPIKGSGAHLSSVEVINRWRLMSSPIRGRASSEVAEKLWILAQGKGVAGVPTRYTHASFSDWWSQLMGRYAEDPIIGGLPMARRNIRPTVLQLRATAADVGVAAAALVGNHSSLRTLMGHYLGRGWFKSELDAKIRHYINLFEAALMSREGGQGIGVEEDVFLARQEEAVATGLGFACRNPVAGVQPGARVGTPCVRLDACATCSMVRFVPSPEAFRSLVLTQKSLLAAEPSFMAANPARWAEVWLPLRAMVEATIELLRASHRKRAFEQIEDGVEQSLANGDMILLRVW